MSASSVRAPDAAADDKPETMRAPNAINSDLLRGVRVSLEVRLGEAPMTVDEMLALKAGAIVTLDTGLADNVELYLNGNLVARGEIVAVGDKYGVRIVEIAPSA
jgi:flagellar motor switch protein FliN/FliY